MRRKLAVLLVMLFLSNLVACVPDQVNQMTVERLDAVLRIELAGERPGDQDIWIDDRYRLEIRDVSEDGRPDSWTLYDGGVIRCRRWTHLGFPEMDEGELFDSKGESVGVLVRGLDRDEEAERIRLEMDEELEKKRK